MRTRTFATAALVAALAAPAGMTAKAYAAQPAWPAQYGQEHPWDEPPGEYREAQRQGFHDGIEAARHDWTEHRHKDADDHQMFKHPPVERDLRGDYREAFKHGYSEAMHHMNNNRDHDHDDHDRY